ncbi:V-type proton ATPase subunit F-like isoform X1 [Abrus precatorius]|uniref:V-type proton ATPase subunit F-like isoform X1 n=1 Tax=Abrus precatorius TaxID=3816 RepID=A0A8B8L228_ABRPR|nr:V-type proton ATPase subunit F-like isoform X1 [Abrus precatorius]
MIFIYKGIYIIIHHPRPRPVKKCFIHSSPQPIFPDNVLIFNILKPIKLITKSRNLSQDTVVGFLLAGVGNVDLRRKTNYLIVDAKTTVKQIEDVFKEFTTREDIAIVLISQYVANMIRFLVDSYNKPVPAILEIPSKDHAYDPTHDSVLSRVKYLFSTESVASGRR